MNQKDELMIYRKFFHRISVYCGTMNNDKVTEGVTLINRWSFAHRSGNGELSEYEQKQRVNNVIIQMDDFSSR